jgi:alkylation response protein AidB-like acyl-CoA dehydrogenase
MDLDFSEEQSLLRETIRGLCEREASTEAVRRLEEDPIGHAPGFWRQLAGLGLVGLRIPEAYGGASQGLLEAVILYEEFGRALAPTPHVASAIMSAGVIARGAGEDFRQAWLPRLASGEIIMAPAWLEPGGGFGPEGISLRAIPEAGDFLLSGVKSHVPFAACADRLLVLARTGDLAADIDLFLVDPTAPGLERRAEQTMALDAHSHLSFDGVRVSAADRLTEGGTGWQAWSDALYEGVILLGGQAMGGAERALEMTVAYAKERQQFGKPLGAFQSLAHYMADAATTVDGGRTLVYEAAWAADQGRSIRRLAPMAKSFACSTFRDVTKMAQQIHGGMGFSVEYDIQLYFRRAKQLQVTWWDTAYCEDLVASDVLDGEGPPHLRVAPS